MATITAGNPFTVDAHFGIEGQASPDAVLFEVESPDNETVTYRFGVDPEVTNPSADYYECALGVLHEITEYRVRAVGYAGSDVTETLYTTIFVIPSAVDPEQLVPPGPMLGPAVTWIVGEDVADCVSVDYGSSAAVFDTVAYAASMALYEISGRVFPGLQSARARPCRNACGCWGGPVSYGVSPWWWGGSGYGSGGGWGWYNETGDKLGCSPLSSVLLSGYPVRQVTEVLIDGVALPEFNVAHGYRQWELRDWRNLVRMDAPPDAPADEAGPKFWPGCQNMALDPDQPGTFEVAYLWGAGVPELGRLAAVEIAQQLWFACPQSGRGGDCVLPAGVTKVVRQEITIERGLLANWLDPTKGTGLVSTDLFLQAYAGGMRRGRRSAVYSPDLQTMAKRRRA